MLCVKIFGVFFKLLCFHIIGVLHPIHRNAGTLSAGRDVQVCLFQNGSLQLVMSRLCCFATGTSLPLELKLGFMQ